MTTNTTLLHCCTGSAWPSSWKRLGTRTWKRSTEHGLPGTKCGTRASPNAAGLQECPQLVPEREWALMIPESSCHYIWWLSDLPICLFGRLMSFKINRHNVQHQWNQGTMGCLKRHPQPCRDWGSFLTRCYELRELLMAALLATRWLQVEEFGWLELSLQNTWHSKWRQHWALGDSTETLWNFGAVVMPWCLRLSKLLNDVVPKCA